MKILLERRCFFTGLAALAYFFTVLALSSCRNTYNTPDPDVYVTGISLNPSAKDLRVGDDPFTITATVSPAHASNDTVTWTVHPEGFIAVSPSSGKTAVISIIKPGVAYVTATTNGTTNDGEHRSAECRVTVLSAEGTLAYVRSVALNKSSFFLDIGETETLTATVDPAEAYLGTVTWASTNPGVATVSDGVVTATGYGQAIIIATSVGENENGQRESASVTVTVIDPNVPAVYVNSITLNKYALSMKVGDNAALTATVHPPETFGVALWRSDNTTVATVNEFGVVTAHAAGTAGITAYSTYTENESEISSPPCAVTVTESSLTPGPATPASADETTIPKPTDGSWTRYEAEDANIHNWNTNHWNPDIAATGTEAAEFYSEGFAVTAIDNTDISAGSIDLNSDWTARNDIGYIHFEVYVQTAGVYTVNIVYNGNDTKQILIKLNDDESHFLELPELQGYGWNRLISKQCTLGYFNQGWNDLYISGIIDSITGDPEDRGWANFDCIDINSPPPPSTAVSDVSLNKTTLNLKMGSTTTETLIATVSPENATYKDVLWSVVADYPSGCVTVSQAGVVTAYQAGTATVMVTTADGGKTASCAVTVEAADSHIYVTNITVDPAALTMSINDTSPLSFEIVPDTATNKAVTWHSSNPDIATVNGNGVVTAHAPGTASIYAQSTYTQNNSPVNSNNCQVTVISVNQLIGFQAERQKTGTFVPALPAVTWTRYEAEAAEYNGTAATSRGDSHLYSGGAYVQDIGNSMSAESFPADWTGRNYVKFTVYVTEDGEYDVDLITNGPDDKTICIKVNNDPHTAHALTYPAGGNYSIMYVVRFRLGLLKAGVPNYIRITGAVAVADAPWMNIDCIDVHSKHPDYTPIDNISLDKASLELQMGAVSTGTLTATINPGNASNKELIWSVTASNPADCVTVSQTGEVTAYQAGTATVTVTAADTENGIKTASCTVTVAAATSDIYVSGITVSPAALNLLVGQSSAALSAAIAPDNATNKIITWHSNDSAIAAVNSSGVVTAHARGTAHIYAQSTHTTGSPVVSTDCVVTVSVNRLIDTLRVANTHVFYPQQSGFTRYEAEDAEPNGTAEISTGDAYLYSGGAYIKDIGNNISAANFPADWTGVNYVKFSVTVPTDGEYQVNIITNGHDHKTIMVKVNDAPHQAHAMTIPGTGGGSGATAWDSIFAVQLGLGTLKADVPNYISIAVAGSQWMNIDCLDVSETPVN